MIKTFKKRNMEGAMFSYRKVLLISEERGSPAVKTVFPRNRGMSSIPG